MKRDNRLSFALHVLLHLAAQPDEAMTSEEMAACSRSHPVVIRQTFAGLRKAGIVSSSRGRGGGWRLARPPSEITLAQVQQALGGRVVAVSAPVERPQCLVERAVNHALDDAIAEATRVLDRHLASITLADLADDARKMTGAPFSMSPDRRAPAPPTSE